MVVFHALVRRKMVANQTGANARNFVGADLGPDTATAHRDPALHLPGRNGASERNDKVRIVIAMDEAVRSEVDDFVSRCLETAEQILFQIESPMIGGDSYTHTTPPVLLVAW